MGFIFAAYAGSQHYGYDFLELREPLSTTRATSTLGNALFAGTLLALTIPVTLGFAASTLKDTLKSTGFWAKVGFWSTVLAVQLLGLVFTFSRGPLFATFGTLATFIVLVALFVGWRQLVRVSVVLALAGALALVVVSLPIPIHQVNDESVAASRVSTSVATTSRSRLTSINGSTGGGLAGRVKIWRTTWDLMLNRPWFEFDTLSLNPIRPLVGYGPELFRSTFLLESRPPEVLFRGHRLLPHEAAHAHNIFLHHGVELGFVGLIASLGIFLAPLSVGAYQLVRLSPNPPKDDFGDSP